MPPKTPVVDFVDAPILPVPLTVRDGSAHAHIPSRERCAIAAHESLRTTKLYDRAGDEITFDEVERIRHLTLGRNGANRT